MKILSCRAHWSVNFMSGNFMPCNFDGPSFWCPSFSVNPFLYLHLQKTCRLFTHSAVLWRSVSQSVTFTSGTVNPWSHRLRYFKLMSRPNSLRYMLTLTPTCVICMVQRNALKIRVEYGWGHEHKTCNISETLQDRTKVTVLWRTRQIGSRIGAFDWYQNQWPCMTLNGLFQ